MKRWHKGANVNLENEKVDKFIEEILAMCKKHGMSISHEDRHGAFIIENYDEHYVEWLGWAHVGSLVAR